MFAPPVVAAAAGAGLGLIAGSFLATVALRWPADRSVGGRSGCDGCGAVLKAYELVPLLSWTAQRGRCRRCGARIDPVHPVAEAAAGAIGAAALIVSPDLGGLCGALFGWVLLLLGLLDVRHHWLPDRLTLPLLGVGLLAALIAPPDLSTRLIGAAAGFVVLEAVRVGYRFFRGREGLGGGDPKLLAAIGAWLGWAALPVVLLGASLLGLATAAGMAAAGHPIGRTTRLPFGAMLGAAAFAIWLSATFAPVVAELMRWSVVI